MQTIKPKNNFKNLKKLDNNAFSDKIAIFENKNINIGENE